MQRTIDENYHVDGQKLEPGAIIRRYDPPFWFEGKVGQISSWDEKQQRIYELVLIVEGCAPSPLYPGDIIEIVSLPTEPPRL